MYIYDIGYHSCEDSCYTQWQHEKQFTQAELLVIVIEGLKVALVDWINEETEWLATMSDAEKKEGRWGPSDPTIEALLRRDSFGRYLENQSFVRVKYETDISLFGWAKANVPGSWAGHVQDNSDTLKLQVELNKIYAEHTDD